MTIDYQMPLFDRYDISVEFERHLRPIRQTLNEEWNRYSFMSDDQLVERFDKQMVCPLELFVQQAELSQIEGALFELAVPYRGDDELWHLYPVDEVRSLDGEVFRGELLLQTLASSASDARKDLDARLHQIAGIIQLQAQRIEIFETALPSIILSEARRFSRPLPAPDDAP